MKLLTNLDCLTPPMTGIGHYTRQLMSRLAVHPDMVTIKGLHRNRWLHEAQMLEWLQALDNEASQPSDWQAFLRHRLRNMPGGYTLRHSLRQLRFAQMAKPYLDHVYWEPGLELGPFGGKRVATLYDLSHLVTPESHPPARVRYLERQVSHTLRKADHIVTISHTMEKEIMAHGGLYATDISVVPPAADASFCPLTQEQQQVVKARHGLPERFILTIGTLEPRKNLVRLAKAYASLPPSLRRAWPLVCVGNKGWNDDEISNELQRLQDKGELLRLGYVAQTELPLITASAGLLAYPSIYEGFGMPVVEALACGVPVLTSRGTAMHEITGESAFLVDPLDTDDITHTLQEALEDTDRRETLASQGPRLAARYDWECSAESMLEALRLDVGQQ